MKTPIADFVKQYDNSGFSRLHMPGHKGKSFSGCERYDITEIKNADVLFESSGIIAESEKNASLLFGTGATLYSAEGSSLCIKAMLMLIKQGEKNKKCKILASRNSHKSFIYGCALLDIDIEWLFGENPFSLCRCDISPELLEKRLQKSHEGISAVYVTSPDYLGGMLDIAALSSVARKFGIPFIVDNAHGAYLRFLDESIHPIDLGADMCCDSAHKTLPALTGGAYLHISKNAPSRFLQNAKTAMEAFGSTSPSYLILQSLDIVNGYLDSGFKDKLKSLIERINKLKKLLVERGYTVLNSDPLKLTIASGGVDLSELMRKNLVECEYEDPDYTVFMFTPENDENDFIRIENALTKCDFSFSENNITMPPIKKAMSVRDAVLSEQIKIDVHTAVGKIAASPAVSCPPAVPVVVSGEEIQPEHIKIFEYYNINKINVVD